MILDTYIPKIAWREIVKLGSRHVYHQGKAKITDEEKVTCDSDYLPSPAIVFWHIQFVFWFEPGAVRRNVQVQKYP
jgi:hypothetical protein